MATDDTKDKTKKKTKPVAEEEVKPKPKAKKVVAEETAEPKPKPRAKKTAPGAEVTEAAAEPKPKAKAKPKVEAAPEPEAVAAPKAEAAEEPKPKPKAKVAKPVVEAPVEEAVEPKPKPKAKPKAEPAPEPAAEVAPAETAEDAKPAKKAKPAPAPAPEPRLHIRYIKEVVPNLMKKFGFKNNMQVPKLLKIAINKGLGRDVDSAKSIESATMELTRISGQKPVITRARKSIANFKLRKGMPVGCRVTLRKRRMYEFLDRLLSIVLPRIRDFRGVSTSAFDGRGNYSLGLTEQLIFPEIKYDDVTRVSGFCISFHTTAANDEECRALLEEMGMPFKK